MSCPPPLWPLPQPCIPGSCSNITVSACTCVAPWSDHGGDWQWPGQSCITHLPLIIALHALGAIITLSSFLPLTLNTVVAVFHPHNTDRPYAKEERILAVMAICTAILLTIFFLMRAVDTNNRVLGRDTATTVVFFSYCTFLGSFTAMQFSRFTVVKFKLIPSSEQQQYLRISSQRVNLLLWFFTICWIVSNAIADFGLLTATSAYTFDLWRIPLLFVVTVLTAPMVLTVDYFCLTPVIRELERQTTISHTTTSPRNLVSDITIKLRVVRRRFRILSFICVFFGTVMGFIPVLRDSACYLNPLIQSVALPLIYSSLIIIIRQEDVPTCLRPIFRATLGTSRRDKFTDNNTSAMRFRTNEESEVSLPSPHPGLPPGSPGGGGATHSSSLASPSSIVDMQTPKEIKKKLRWRRKRKPKRMPVLKSSNAVSELDSWEPQSRGKNVAIVTVVSSSSGGGGAMVGGEDDDGDDVLA